MIRADLERFPLLRAGVVTLPCFLPVFYRWSTLGLGSGNGFISDLAVGMLLLGGLLLLPFRSLRFLVLLCWFALQLGALELYTATGRFPVVQDLQYLFDPTFLAGSTDGFHFSAPYYTLILGIVTVCASVLGPRLCLWRWASLSLAAGLAGFLLYSSIDINKEGQGVNYRYNPVHWLVIDVLNSRNDDSELSTAAQELVQSLGWQADEGVRILPVQPVRNVLIVTLEGIPGIAIPDIRDTQGAAEASDDLIAFGRELGDAMLVPDFAVHSHQTIRGLYAIHCGDFSKLSFGMPKAFELQLAGSRADSCLPAQLAKNGWRTHFLQGAPLQFMNKDKAMPVMGFQEVHGVEWFEQKNDNDFIWGTTDPDFFRGAKKYITNLRQQDDPWFLSLLTVATHQPFAATDEQVRHYGSRKNAAMAELDRAVADFLVWLRKEQVLEDTLVIFTSDESHGAPLGDWVCSWGYAAVLTPENKQLPHVKAGRYGLLDIEASVLDYFGLPVPAEVRGRSLFRDYDTGRNMLSYTAGILRWQDTDNGLLECIQRTDCRFYPDASMIGSRPASSASSRMLSQTMYGAAGLLDKSLQQRSGVRVMDFAQGEIREIPEKIRNEWTDNLVGAQYLEFPANSTTVVDIAVEAIGAKDTEVSLRLVLRQFEKEVGGIEVPQFPVLHDGEKASARFRFANPKRRQAFSFHLVGEGQHAKLRLDTFRVTITDSPEKD